MPSTDLLDVNVWLALAEKNREHHPRAEKYWERGAAAQLAFTRVSVLGLLRLLTSRTVMQNRPLTVPEAWAAYHAFRELPEVVWFGEHDSIGARVDERLADWAGDEVLSPPHWTDAYLAALAVATGCRLVSFDADFKRRKGLSFLRLG